MSNKLLSQGFRFHKLIKTFTKFNHGYTDLVSKSGCTCSYQMKQGISDPTFYGNELNKV